MKKFILRQTTQATLHWTEIRYKFTLKFAPNELI